MGRYIAFWGWSSSRATISDEARQFVDNRTTYLSILSIVVEPYNSRCARWVGHTFIEGKNPPQLVAMEISWI